MSREVVTSTGLHRIRAHHYLQEADGPRPRHLELVEGREVKQGSSLAAGNVLRNCCRGPVLARPGISNRGS